MRKVILDTDPGVDDAYAIQFLLNADVDILAFTTVAGNCGAEQGARNLCRLLDANKRQIPVYIGQKGPIIKQPIESCSEYHGKDGFGDVPDAVPTVAATDYSNIKPDKAPLKLIELIQANPGEVDLLAVGPLTNLAVAVKLEPQLPSLLKSLTIMGGNMNGVGNTHLVGEFNFYGDPEGAKMVLDEYTPLVPTTIVTWEATCINLFPSTHFDTAGKSVLGDFFHAIRQHSLSNFDKEKQDEVKFQWMWHRFGDSGACMCDLLAPIVLLYPELVTTKEDFPVSVELNGQYTRSMMVVDRMRQFHTILPNRSPACLVVEVDIAKASKLAEMKFY